MTNTAQVSAAHMDALFRGAPFADVARVALVNAETLRKRYYENGGAQRAIGRRPIAADRRAAIVADILSGLPPKTVATTHGIGLSTVFAVFRGAGHGRCIDHRPARKADCAPDQPKSRGGRPPLDPQIKRRIIAAIESGEKTTVVASRHGVSRVTVFRFVRDAQRGEAA